MNPALKKPLRFLVSHSEKKLVVDRRHPPFNKAKADLGFPERNNPRNRFSPARNHHLLNALGSLDKLRELVLGLQHIHLHTAMLLGAAPVPAGPLQEIRPVRANRMAAMVLAEGEIAAQKRGSHGRHLARWQTSLT